MILSKSRLFALSFAFLILGARHAYAQATFGAEFNFSNDKLLNSPQTNYVNSPESEEARDALLRRVLSTCDGCRSASQMNHYGVTTHKVTYQDGWYFEIATDPGMVEIQTKPSTSSDVAQHLAIIQKDIFDSAKAVGLMPATYFLSNKWAGSHIHVGAESSLGSGISALRLLRNILVDFTNHAELADGIFSSDLTNAPALYRLPEAERSAFIRIIRDVDSGKIQTVEKFAQRIRDEVYDKTIQNLTPTSKYQAFNLNRIGNLEFSPGMQTWELRAMRGQESAKDFLIEIQLIEARINYLKAAGSLIKLEMPFEEMSREVKVANFYDYVTDTGLSFANYEKFLSTTEKLYLPRVRTKAAKISCGNVFH